MSENLRVASETSLEAISERERILAKIWQDFIEGRENIVSAFRRTAALSDENKTRKNEPPRMVRKFPDYSTQAPRKDRKKFEGRMAKIATAEEFLHARRNPREAIQKSLAGN